MISVIIPVYNVEKYLSQCLESVLAQTYNDFEVVLVDDGSPDSSGAICEEYACKDSRVRVIHQKNAGVSGARNTGIEKAKGEWLTFIDSDDFVATDYLESFKVDNSDADIIVQGLVYYNNQTREFFNPIQLKDAISSQQNFKEFVSESKLLDLGFPVAKAYRSNLVNSQQLRFDTDLSYHEDHVFVLEALTKAKVVRTTSSIAYKYRCYHSLESLSTKHHPWQKLILSSEKMLACIDRMKTRFLIEGSDYSRSIYNFAYNPKIDAIYELFGERITSLERKANFLTIVDRYELSHKYHPTKISKKIVKYILLYMPYPAISFFMSLVVYKQKHGIA